MKNIVSTHTSDCVRQRAKFGARSAARDVCSCGGDLPEIVKRALVETVTDIGQLSKSDLYTLNKYVKRGWLSRGKGGPYPILKTVYAHPGFDFTADRDRYVEAAMAMANIEQRLRESGYFDTRSPNYGVDLGDQKAVQR
jgi:hypothetical protein